MDENKNTTDNEKQSWADKAEDTLQDLKGKAAVYADKAEDKLEELKEKAEVKFEEFKDKDGDITVNVNKLTNLTVTKSRRKKIRAIKLN